MPKPTGPQFVQLYRGLEGVTPETLDVHQMGPHWTTDPGVAYHFSGTNYEDTEGTVVGALVHKRHIIPVGSQEHDNIRDRWGIADADEPLGRVEKEHTVRLGAPLHVTEITHIPEDYNVTTTHRKDMSLSDLRKFRA